jgi:Alpha/beta hydrolase family
MSTFALIHGGGDVGWSWHLVEAALRSQGHDTVAPDLPCEDDTAGLAEYADTVVRAVGDWRDADLVVVGHSLGAFTAPLVADRLGADRLVLLAGMIPVPGEAPGRWWANTGYAAAVREQAARDGGLTGHEDPLVSFMHDVPPELAAEALRRERDQSGTPMAAPWPLPAWPDVPTRFVLCRDDRFFPAAFLRRLSEERLGITAEEVPGSHCASLARPREVAAALTG